MNPADFEKLGAFYLGREYDIATKAMAEGPVMYDSKDLVTHGVVLGMTGSGKTGLCLAILEEAAIDKIPAIVIDPKGDISNFLLTFPNLTGPEFRPWINEEDAEKKGQSPDEYAAAQAALWQKGLADWGQSGERIKTLRDTVDINIFTPGSNAGIPISILASLGAPEFEIVDDAELFAERIETTSSSLLGLLGIKADPISSREHILLSHILEQAWRAGKNLDLAKIIGYVQAPPFEQIGVVGMEEFFPEKKRSEFAMLINNLLASPGFQTWLTGEALDIKKMLHTADGKPRVSVLSIAHLNDAERMFFVSLVLNQMVGWMRSQSGTTSLRALLYMDEIYGFLPPTENPPSKKPMMILLKQARAFGLGVLLATQNPVDLDYKALSNTGTWWLGRLQTERDKARVLDGLEGAAAAQGGKFDRQSIDKMLAALGNRIFLMNNVHEDGPCVMQVRWCLSYLRGPLTRSQIKSLMDPKRAAFSGTPVPAPKAAAPSAAAPPVPAEAPEPSKPSPSAGGSRPDLPPSIPQYYLPVTSPAASPLPVRYLPALLVAAEVLFTDRTKDISAKQRFTFLTPFKPEQTALPDDDGKPVTLDASALTGEPVQGATWSELPLFARKAGTYTDAKSTALERIYQNQTLDILCCRRLEAFGKPGESEGDFRARLQHSARETRDGDMDRLKQKYAVRLRNLAEDRARAQAALDREKDQATAAKASTGISILGGLLSVLTGRKSTSTAISKGATAMRSATRAWQQSGDVGRAKERLAAIEEEEAAINAEIEQAAQSVRDSFDISTEPLETESIRPLKKNIAVIAAGLAWIPYYDVGGGQLEAAFGE
ncbi:MAG TPA: DUF87 domain-containing protein [Verrucomicrobiales bacterium]|nr:DUF87 domain-containing protein [Verrucomicrobiales bacterium]